MSSSRQISCLHRQRRATQKSSFAHTCNLLSQYIKEKGNLRDLNLEIDGRVQSLEALVKPKTSSMVQASIKLDRDKENQAEEKPFNTVKDASHKSTRKNSTATASASAADSKSAPLTMFYSGKVLVFKDFPADKAGEILALAKKGSSQMSYGIPSNTLCATVPTAPSNYTHANPTTRHEVAAPLNGISVPSDSCRENIDNAVFSSRVTPQPQANATDLPIARRSSIHRFLEKRKDRSMARAPYKFQQEEKQSYSSQLQLKL